MGPKGSVGWVVAATVDPGGRWYDERVTHDQPVEADQGETVDNGLPYTNGHVLSTQNVFGVAGGPPLGLHQNPHCHSCNRLMFHVVTVQNYLREYGPGWRSLYLCERCHRTTCTATNWN